MTSTRSTATLDETTQTRLRMSYSARDGASPFCLHTAHGPCTEGSFWQHYHRQLLMAIKDASGPIMMPPAQSPWASVGRQVLAQKRPWLPISNRGGLIASRYTLFGDGRQSARCGPDDSVEDLAC